MAAVDSRATATTAGEEQREERELHARRQEDNDDDATHGQDGLHASLPRTSSVSHKQIQPPRYVRSIPIGLQRANTLTSVNTGSSTGTGSPVKQQQSTSGTHVKVPRSRRTSVPFPDEEKGRTLPPRSESALGLSGTSTKSSDVTSPVKMSFSRSYNGLPAPDRKLQSLLFDYGDTSQVSELPSDPKTWTPSQLSIYLSHMLRLTPRPVIADVMKFVVQRGLTGKRFLRLRNQDLIEMGININWCKVLSTARERLRRECLRGRIFGFTVQSTDDGDDTVAPAEGEEGEETIESLFLRLPTSTSATSLNQEWNKNSWRRNEGKKSRGRVKGIAKVFEESTASSSNDIPDELGRKRSLSTREAELYEISRIRRNRQESNDSITSATSSNDIYNNIPYSPKITSSNTYVSFRDTANLNQDGTERAGTTTLNESESEAEEDHFGSFNNKVDWSSVEPLAMEETASLSEDFFADSSLDILSSSSSSSSPSTPCASTFRSSTIQRQDEDEQNKRKDEEKELMEEKVIYQSRILSHGQDAYAAVRARKQSDLSEVTDESSEEHLAYWQQVKSNVQQSEESEVTEMTGGMSNSDNGGVIQEGLETTAKAGSEAKAESATMTFAESDGNIVTMKKHPFSIGYSYMGSLSKKTRSVEDFGNLKFHTLQSKTSIIQTGSTRIALKDLFGDEEKSSDGQYGSHGRDPGENKITAPKTKDKDSKRLSDLFRDDEQSEQYYSLKSRSGSIMILPRAEVEEMQARLRDLEQQLELAKSASASRASCHSKSSSINSAPSLSRHLEQQDRQGRESKSQAMSEWVKGALGEANTIVSGGREEPSWLGLGSWALAAGLGIGIVVGEAVFSKLRR